MQAPSLFHGVTLGRCLASLGLHVYTYKMSGPVEHMTSTAREDYGRQSVTGTSRPFQ